MRKKNTVKSNRQKTIHFKLEIKTDLKKNEK